MLLANNNNFKNNILDIVIIYIIICICYIRGNYVEAFSMNFFHFLSPKRTQCVDEIYATLCCHYKRKVFASNASVTGRQ